MKMYIGQLLIGALFSMICAGGVWFICNDPKSDIPKYRSKKLHERNRRLIIKEKDYSKLLSLYKENNIEIIQ